MKTGLWLGAIALSGSAMMAVANDSYRYECRHDRDLRTIEVVYLQRESAVPCEVRYTKDEMGKEKVSETLWKANYEAGYCESEAASFVEKQEGWGWSCERVAEVRQED